MHLLVDDRPANSASFLTRLCAAAVAGLPVDAAGLNLIGERTGMPIQFSIGLPWAGLQRRLSSIDEGPVRDAWGGANRILISDLSDSAAMARYPRYTSAALASRIRSVSVLPLGTATVRVGTLDLYGYSPQEMAPPDLEAATTFAIMATRLLIAGPAVCGEVRRWPHFAQRA
jgi:hypothetical protein